MRSTKTDKSHSERRRAAPAAQNGTASETPRFFAALAAKDDLENFLAGMQIAAIFLDEEDRIQNFTPAVADIYNLLRVDIGRKLSDITHNVPAMPTLPTMAEALEAEGPVEHEVQTTEGRHFLRRVLPYRPREGEATGLVVAFVDVTELRESEEKYRKVLDAALDCVITIDAAGRIVDFNRAAEETFGLTRDAVAGRDLADTLIPAEYRAAHTEGLRRFLETGQGPILNRRLELSALRANGTEFPVELTVSVIPARRRGDGTRFVAYLRDITDRQRAEQDKAALAAIVSSSEDAIVSKDLHGIVQTWNAGAERLFGYSAEEMIGKPIRRLIPPERQAEEDEILDRLSRGERMEHYETVRVTKDGRHVHVALTISPIRNAAGEVLAASKIARDITERKRAHEQLRRSEERYRKIFQSAYVSIWQEDFTAVKGFIAELQAEGIDDVRSYFQEHPDEVEKAISLVRVVDVNEATLAMFEAADASELVESLDRVFLPETRAAFIEQLVAVAEQRGVVSSETRLRTVRGRPIHVVFSASFPSAPADWSSVLISLMDVTEQRQAEQALRDTQERLRLAVRNAPLILYHCDRELRYTWFADEPHPDFPMAELLGRTPREVLGDDGEPLMEAMDRVIQSGRGERIEFSLNTTLGRQTWDNNLEPLRDFTGNIIGITGCALEVTERKQAEQRQQLLLAELSHRVKNTLATVQSVATQTGIHARSVPEFRKSFEARLHSLAQTHSLLTRSRWKGAELRAIIVGEMGAHGGIETGRVRLTGPTIYLTPKAALSLHLVLHELATNAAKYGALLCEAGIVEITWSIKDESGRPYLQLSWRESAGPKVSPPARRGFGTTVIENSVVYELDGQTHMQYLEEGIRCEFLIPWSDEIGFAAQSS